MHISWQVLKNVWKTHSDREFDSFLEAPRIKIFYQKFPQDLKNQREKEKIMKVIIIPSQSKKETILGEILQHLPT